MKILFKIYSIAFLIILMSSTVFAEIQFTYNESTRISLRNPTYDNNNYSFFALAVEGPINFLDAGKMDGFIFEVSGELCFDKDHILKVEGVMPCDGLVLATDENANEILSGGYQKGDRFLITDNFCGDFFNATTEQMLTSAEATSYTLSLKCHESFPAQLELTEEGHVFNVEKIFAFSYDDGVDTYNLSKRNKNQSPFIAKTPLNVPIVFGDIFNKLGVECRKGKSCHTEVANFILDLVTNPVAIENINKGNVVNRVKPIIESRNTDICLPKDGCEKLKVSPEGKLPKTKEASEVDGVLITFNMGENFESSSVECSLASVESEEDSEDNGNGNGNGNDNGNGNGNNPNSSSSSSVAISCGPGLKSSVVLNSFGESLYGCCRANNLLYFYEGPNTCHCVKGVK